MEGGLFSLANVVIALMSAAIAAIVGVVTYKGVVSQRRSIELQYFVELRRWAEDAIQALSEAVHLCDLDPAVCVEPNFFNRRHALRIRISTLIDSGRWFFPNSKSKDLGEWKQEGYQSFRHPSLDALVYAYQALGAMDYNSREKNKLLREPLVYVKREFVGAIQKRLDPRKMDQEFGNAMLQE